MDPGSRLFVSLAEEYRKIGRFRQALSALQKGLLAHPGYIAAQVALGRVYLEVAQTTDAIATFTKVLVADPGNLVAAKSLAEVQLARGDNLEALKKYKLYRALSGDRKVDEAIVRLEAQVAPKPVIPVKAAPPVEAPPPPRFQETGKSARRIDLRASTGATPLREPDAFDITSVAFDPGEDSGKSRPEDPFPLFTPTRDTSLAPHRVVSASGPAQKAPPLPRDADAEAPPVKPPAEPALTEDGPVGSRPTGRALADLYYTQGHYAEALQIYDDLVLRHPFDEELTRMRRESEARLLPAGGTSSLAAAPDPARGRRVARIRALQHWLSRVQAG